MKIKYAPSRAFVNRALRSYVAFLKKKFGPSLIVLFGSYAKGTYSYGSDVDLLIVASNLPDDYGRRYSELLDIDIGVAVQPFAYTEEEFRGMLAASNSFVTSAIKNGTFLYRSRRLQSLLVAALKGAR